MAVIVVCLLVYVGCIVFIRVRNREPFGLKRQLSDFSTFMVPFNIPAYLLSKVPTTARMEQSWFPELQLIEDNWETIRDEALAPCLSQRSRSQLPILACEAAGCLLRRSTALANGYNTQMRTPSHGWIRASRQEINAVATTMATALSTKCTSFDSPADSSCFRHAAAIAPRARPATR